MRHNNTSITQNLHKVLNTKGEYIDEINPSIQPIIAVPIYTNVVKSNTLSNATSLTLYTTPTDKDFFLTALQLSFIKDASATATQMGVTVVIDGVTTTLVRAVGLTTTAQSGNLAQTLPFPIKLDRGSIISIVNNTGVANVTTWVNIMGYTQETINTSTQ